MSWWHSKQRETYLLLNTGIRERAGDVGHNERQRETKKDLERETFLLLTTGVRERAGGVRSAVANSRR